MHSMPYVPPENDKSYTGGSNAWMRWRSKDDPKRMFKSRPARSDVFSPAAPQRSALGRTAKRLMISGYRIGTAVAYGIRVSLIERTDPPPMTSRPRIRNGPPAPGLRFPRGLDFL